MEDKEKMKEKEQEEKQKKRKDKKTLEVIWRAARRTNVACNAASIKNHLISQSFVP